MMERAAIVIGVNKTGNLPVLRAGVSGARQFADWLTGEGFDVSVFVDDPEPVTTAAIINKVTALIERGTLEQLVVYFSGHGFLQNYNGEVWMLSEAPQNANEAISVRESVDLARECGVPNVVIISDTCRSTSDSLQAGRVRGSLIFPNAPVSRNVRPEVDRYFAALPGNPAHEMVVNESVRQHEGIFTHCFLKAYKKHDAGMVHEVLSGGNLLKVVPNRRLKKYLRREVPVLLRRKKLLVDQLPDAIVESGDDVYIGQVAVEEEPLVLASSSARVRFRPIIPRPRVRRKPPRASIDVGDIANVALARAIGSSSDIPKSVASRVDETVGQSDFDASVKLVEKAQQQGARDFDSGTGFKVVGARVSEALGLNMRAELLSGGNGAEPAYVRLSPSGMAGGAGHVSSVVIRFADGSGTVLAAIENYIGTVAVEKGLVVNVSYAPSQSSYLRGPYEEARARLENLRAIVASAARFGVFRVDSRDVDKIAGQIRTMKSIDPTLGLYAAYAYAEVGLRDQIVSVMSYMQRDFEAMLFDVAMLAGTLAEPQSGNPYPVVPFCPMLSQGWTLLRVKRAKVPPAAEEAFDHLLPALWTTFDSTGMDLIVRAIHERRIS